MIKVKITHCPDFDAIDEYEFFYDRLYVGSKNEDIIIKSEDFKDLVLILECKENGLKTFLSDNDSSFKVNGKSIMGERITKPGDIISIGETQIQIITHKISEKDVMDKIKNNIDIIEQLPEERKKMIQAIESTLQKI